MFQPARWKAYLKDIHDNENNVDGDNPEPGKNIYPIYHSQKIWFTRDEDNGHQKAAEEHLKRSNALLEECTTMVDDLEETLANTPKPSTVLDWSRLW